MPPPMSKANKKEKVCVSASDSPSQSQSSYAASRIRENLKKAKSLDSHVPSLKRKREGGEYRPLTYHCSHSSVKTSLKVAPCMKTLEGLAKICLEIASLLPSGCVWYCSLPLFV